MKKTTALKGSGAARTARFPQERSIALNVPEDPLAAEEPDVLTGNPPIESRPTNQDILPDQVFRRGAEPDEEQITARPSEPPPPQTIPPPDHPQDLEDSATD